MAGPSETQQNEESTAQIFLSLYNERVGAHYGVAELGDHPDVKCVDADSGAVMYVEVGLVPEVEGEVADLMKRIRSGQPFEYFIGQREFWQDTLPAFRDQLKEKMLSRYGPNTALVLRGISGVWDLVDFRRVPSTYFADLLVGAHEKYGAGVWILCAGERGPYGSHDLFELSARSDGDVS